MKFHKFDFKLMNLIFQKNKIFIYDAWTSYGAMVLTHIIFPPALTFKSQQQQQRHEHKRVKSFVDSSKSSKSFPHKPQPSINEPLGAEAPPLVGGGGPLVGGAVHLEGNVNMRVWS